ncbi:C1 family peptidase [Fodinicola feengrottensis]|uniref:C1 family peptidase n=1 Tax=Fodinicola feengrottensis TaxID=435914 RepID=UPI0013D02E0F|nr:C1 family peptidase [Fodinicola feengrottensis]
MTRPIAGYGWIPDLPDFRDLEFTVADLVATALPASVDLREHCPAVYDQGHLGSCTANAIGGALQFDQIRQQETDFAPSRLFIYYSEREVEGTVGSDSGAMIRDGIKCVNKLGAPPETDWAYDITKFTQKPPQQAYDDAAKHQALKYQRVTQTVDDMKGCLASGLPFVFGFSVYESFESPDVAKTGDAPMPAKGEKLLGGHAVLAVGYDDATSRFLVRNSWGDGWGQQGYFTLPYDYLTHQGLASDFWVVQSVE